MMPRTSLRDRTPGIVLGALLLATSLLSGCSPIGESKLNAVKRAGELVVLTRNSPTTYYEGPDGPAGLEYDLAKAFADHLGVSLRMEVPEQFADIIPMIANNQADFAAAGLTITPARLKLVRFTPPYQEVHEQVVYRTGTVPPKNLEQLQGRPIDVVAGTSYVEHLDQLKLLYPGLEWNAINNTETEDLLLRVREKESLLTIADSNIVALSQQFYPELRVAFSLKPPEEIAWAFPQGPDNSLYNAAVDFIDEMRRTGELNHLIDRYYGAASRFNPINMSAYIEKVKDALPAYEPTFEAAAKKYNLDWRLLAAMAYQESFWDPDAESPTGVRGMMMLTQTTADHINVANRENPAESIFGGAEYIRRMIDRLPSHIHEPDRTWMALAAYNVGINHLEDARIITQQQGGNPDKWNDVRKRLPLLSEHAWYSKTKHGYARGYEPVEYVNRIRAYYNVLVKMNRERRARHHNDALDLRAPAL